MAKDDVTQTLLIQGYMRLGNIADAETVFKSMDKYTNYCLSSMVEGYARNFLFDKINELYQKIEQKTIKIVPDA